MLDQQKITLMTRLALFEKDTGKEDFRLAKYYRSDYIRLQMLKTLICTTLAFGIVVLMFGIYRTEYIMEQAAELGYERLALLLLIVYLIFIVISEIVSMATASLRMKMSRKRLGNYYNRLRALRRYYKEQEEV